MIDLHAHVLPGIDDGPETLEASIELLAAMAAQGVEMVVAAAHALDGRYNATRDGVLRATEQVNEALQAKGLPIQVLPGMELLLGFNLLSFVKRGQVLGVNQSRYLIVELPAREYPLFTDRALFELMIAGYRPVLNHPERNRAIQKDPDLARKLANKGIMSMVTAASLLGRFGAPAQQLAQTFLKEGVSTMVVSDAHDLNGRAPMLPEGLEIARAFGKHDQSAEAGLLGLA